MSTTTTNRETSSSTGVVFAKAKSEWVIPQRAKPGRKSSKATTNTASTTAATTTTRNIPSTRKSETAVVPGAGGGHNPPSTSGSRDAQRAFRERKSEYITSLETRIDAFERGEIQRNVALQSAARSLKEENTRLKSDLTRVRRDVEVVLGGLRGEVGRLEGVAKGLRGEVERWERRAKEAERRWREVREVRAGAVADHGHGHHGSGASSPEEDSMSMEENDQARDTRDYDVPTNGIMLPHHREQTRPIISSGGKKTSFSSPTPLGATTTTNSMSISPDSSAHPHPHPHPQSDPDLISDSDSISRQVAMDMACGFCEGIESVCVCRIVREGERVAAAAQQQEHQQQQQRQEQQAELREGSSFGEGARSGIFPVAGTTVAATSPPTSIVNPVTKQLTPTYHAEITAAVRSTSILDNLPPVEPAIPLRRRQRRVSTGEGATSAGVEGGKRLPIFAVSPAISMGVAGVMDASMLGSPGEVLYIPPAECSGDPRNCPACKDDEFGREFCESLSKSMCNNEPGHRCENCPGEQRADRVDRATTATTTRTNVVEAKGEEMVLGSTRARSDSDKVSSSPTDIEAEYLDIKCCGNSKLCGTTDVHCADDDDDNQDEGDGLEHGLGLGHGREHGHRHGQGHDHRHDLGGSSQDRQKPRTFSNGPGPLPSGTWEEKISQLAPHGHEVDVTLTADEAWKTLKAHPNAKFASLAMLADVVARGTKCLGQPSPPVKSADRPDPFSSVQVFPRVPSIEAPALTGNKRRRFEVQSYAVKEALAVLDAHPGHPLKKRRLSDLRGT